MLPFSLTSITLDGITTTQIFVFLLFIFYCLHRLLLKHPALLWSSTPLDPVRDSKILRVRTVAHRGGRVTTIENTLSSFKNAYKNNMDMIELDVHLTADKQVVVFHDDNLWRMAQMNSTISDLNKKDLPKLCHDHTWGSAFHWFQKRSNDREESKAVEKGENQAAENQAENQAEDLEVATIPLLTEVLDSLPENVCVIVEIKPQKERERTIELVKLVDEILIGKDDDDCKKSFNGRVLWFSLHAETCNVVLPNQNPNRPRITSARESAIIVISYWLMLLPFLPE